MKFGRKEPLLGSLAMDDGNNGETATLPRGLPSPAPPARSASGMNQELNAFLGDGCIYEGKLTFEGRVRIDGKFTGEIFSTDTLEVGPGAELEAEIDVRQVIIAGRVEGNIHARGRCDLRAPGEVIGNIVSPIITMEEGVQFDGAMQMKAALEGTIGTVADQDLHSSGIQQCIWIQFECGRVCKILQQGHSQRLRD